MNKFLKKTIKEAIKGLNKKEGGPFGAVIVKDGKVIASAHNQVIKTNDPTAHAEIQVIRKATKKLKRFDLSDCEIYSSCEPCPMCLAAIHWAKIKKLFFGCTKTDAKNIGFDDEYIYDVIKGKATELQVDSVQIDREKCLELFTIWENLINKTNY
jgi:guanine deaminase